MCSGGDDGCLVSLFIILFEILIIFFNEVLNK